MATSPENWETVKALFEAALELDSSQRAAFLQANCPDPAARAEVGRLLSEHDQAGSFLSTPILDKLSPKQQRTPNRFTAGELLASRFRIIRFMAAGGMGEVYEAEDLELREHVALKTIRPEILRQADAVKRFKHEVHLARKVTHPNVNRIFDLFRHKSEGNQEETLFVSMELLRGKTLSDRLREGRMSMADALPLLTQMASALKAAHEAGIVHRDFKPGNVILVDGESGGKSIRAVVTDFGLALQSASVGASLATLTTASIGRDMFGTPAYMAPEQIKGQPATGASDIYAFGLVMYETVTGVHPFQGDTPISAAVKRLTEEPLPPRKFCPALKPASEAVILRCLEREPAKRFSNAEELVRALAVGTVDIPDLRRTWGRQPRIWLIVAVLLAAAIGITYRFRIAANHVENAQPKIQARRSVAVLGFKNLSGKPELGWISTALAEELTSELEAGEKLRTIPGENVVLMKSDLSFPETEGLGGNTLAKIRRALGSDLVVSGSYLEVDQRLRVDLRVQDAVAGETVATFTDTAAEGQILELMSRVGEALRARCGAGGITPAQAAAVKATQPSSPEVSRLYAQGLDKLRIYDAVSARDLLQKAVAEDPKYGPAHSALAEAWSKLGYGQRAIEEAGKAVDLSTNLSHEEQLSIQGQYRAAKKEWSKAAEIYGELFGTLPDNIDYGLHLAAAQTAAGRSQEALATLAALRKLAFPVGDDPRIDLAEALAADTLGDYKRELEVAKRAFHKGEAGGGRFVVTRALTSEGAALRALGETKLAMAAFEQASSLSTALGDRGGKPLIMIGNTLAEQGDFDRAQATFEQALRNARAIGDRATECIALTNIAHVHSDRGDLTAAKPLYIEALGVQREIEDTRNAGSTLSNLGHLLYHVGNYSEAAKTLDESLAIARQVGNRRSEAYVLGFIGDLRYAEGNLAESKARSEESLAIAREIGHKRVVESSLSGIGTVLLAQGDFSGAQKFQKDALAVAKEIGEKGSAAQYGLELAQISLEKGLPSEAEALAREPLAEFQSEKARGEEALAQTVIAQALLAQNKVASARTVMSSAGVAAAHTQHYLIRFNVELTNALVRAASDQTAAAKTQLRAAISRAAAVGCIPCEFQARLVLGRLEMKSGNRGAGRGDLEHLEKDATGKGFLLIARKAAAGGRAGVTPPMASSEGSQTAQMRQ